MFYTLARLFFRVYFILYHRVSIRGLDRLRMFFSSERGGRSVILAANHASYLDPPLVGMAFPRKLRFVAWDQLFTVPIFASLIRALGAVPVSHENKNSAAGLLRQAMGFIEEGFDVLIFPEGERTPDGTLQPLEGGTALIASKTSAPIVPIWIEGTWEAYPIHRLFPRPHKITIVFGEPILPENLPEGMPEKERRNALLDELCKRLEAMRDSFGPARADRSIFRGGRERWVVSSAKSLSAEAFASTRRSPFRRIFWRRWSRQVSTLLPL